MLSASTRACIGMLIAHLLRALRSRSGVPNIPKLFPKRRTVSNALILCPSSSTDAHHTVDSGRSNGEWRGVQGDHIESPVLQMEGHPARPAADVDDPSLDVAHRPSLHRRPLLERGHVDVRAGPGLDEPVVPFDGLGVAPPSCPVQQGPTERVGSGVWTVAERLVPRSPSALPHEVVLSSWGGDDGFILARIDGIRVRVVRPREAPGVAWGSPRGLEVNAPSTRPSMS